MIKLIYTWIIIATLATVNVSSAEMLNDGHIKDAQNALKLSQSALLTAYANNFNRNYSLEFLGNELSVGFHSAADKAYLRTLLASVNHSDVYRPTVSVSGETIIIDFADGHKLTITSPEKDPTQFKINGRDFKFDAKAGLKANHIRLSSILDDLFFPRNALMDFFLPQANAQPWAKIVGLGAALVALIAYYRWDFFSVSHTLQVELESCQNRNKSQPYSESPLAAELQVLKTKSIFNPDQNPLDCPSWSKTIFEADTHGDSLADLMDLCKLANRLTTCVRQYKTESTQLPPAAPTAPTGK